MLESSKVPALTRAIEILNLIARIGPCRPLSWKRWVFQKVPRIVTERTET
jgi:hypothetical protein